jgi:hypothetical protein
VKAVKKSTSSTKKRTVLGGTESSNSDGHAVGGRQLSEQPANVATVVKRGMLQFGLQVDFAGFGQACGDSAGALRRRVAHGFGKTLASHIVIIGIQLRELLEIRPRPVAAARPPSNASPRDVCRKTSAAFATSRPKRIRILRNQARSFIKLLERFFEVLLLFQLQPAGVGVMGFFQIVLGGVQFIRQARRCRRRRAELNRRIVTQANAGRKPSAPASPRQN